MSVSPTYENYEYIADGPVLKSQSIVECRLADWSENRILAISPNVVCGEAEVQSGEVRYGGKLFFSVVAAAPDGTLVAAGSDSSGECDVSSISGAKAVACGNGFTAVLLDTGAVTVLGSFADASVSSWNVKKIAAGADHLLGKCGKGHGLA